MMNAIIDNIQKSLQKAKLPMNKCLDLTDKKEILIRNMEDHCFSEFGLVF